MSQGPLCPNLTQKVQKEVSQIANRNLPCVILLGGLSVNLNHLKRNELRFPYGINFKFNGMLHHNMARVWIVTKFPIPKFDNLKLKENDLLPECDFRIKSENAQAWTEHYLYLTDWMHQICM